MCEKCEAKIKGLTMKKKRRGIRGLNTNGLLSTGKNLAATFGGYYAADYLTESVDFLKSNDVTDGVIKVGTALGAGLIPMVAKSDMAMSGVLGWGLHGVKKLINSFATDAAKPFVHGNSWDSYDRNAATSNGKRI